MCKLNRNISMLAFAVIMLGVLLTACGSPPSTAQSEEELIFYMREHIILKEILPNFAYIPPTDTPGYVNRAQTSLIVLAPLKKNLDDLHQPLDLDHPIQAWWYANNRLGDVGDPIVAINLYRENYMTSSGLDAWGYYELGIFSISEDGQEAEVYLGVSCGLKCGHGNLFMFERNKYGEWRITGSEWMWIE